MLSVQATFFTTLFQARVRYTGLSVAYQVSAIVGGFTPLISLTFLQHSDGSPWRVAAFLAADHRRQHLPSQDDLSCNGCGQLSRQTANRGMLGPMLMGATAAPQADGSRLCRAMGHSRRRPFLVR